MVFQDPYLSGLSSDPEEASFMSMANRLTPLPDDESTQHGNWDNNNNNNNNNNTTTHDHTHPSLSASDLRMNDAMHAFTAGSPFQNRNLDQRPNDSMAPAQSLLDFDSDGLSPLSGANEKNSWHHQPRLVIPENMHHRQPMAEGFNSIEGTISTAQLLSPDTSRHPSPSPATPNNLLSTPTADSRLSSPTFEYHGAGSVPRHPFISSPVSDNLSAHWGSESARGAISSPIVKVESYSRGDSPERDSFTRRRQHSQSSMHLSPNGVDEDDDEEDSEDPDDAGRSVARSTDGAWLRDSATGLAGVNPSCRGDIYVHSPMEVEMQRQLDERNEVIMSWSASVSVANSEAGDDEPPVRRGRKNEKGLRRRAKSAGDPSLHQDYFSRFGSSAIPGPGVLVHESSEDEEEEREEELPGEVAPDVADTPPVSVDEATSLERPRPDDGEHLPGEMLRVPPWQDDCDSAQDTAKEQPETSSAAMMEFIRRARDMETMSRRATWGTRPISQADVNSIIGGGGSFENLTINDDGTKKQERRSSLRRLFPRKTASHLKRQLSEISHSHPGGGGDEPNKEPEGTAPQRKDSFPHIHGRKLSLGRSSKPRNLSTGGAVIAIASQMAAVGGRESLRAVSPGTAPSQPWYSHQARGRSRSELPRPSAPGLVDLMTSNGGPPVANLAYPGQPAGNNQVVNAKGPEMPGGGGGGDDDDDDEDDLTDAKGLVMEFPVLARLPVPTVEGFRSQIAQLNPRLQPALVERFANEQVRRYRKLVDSKLNHSRAVSNNACPAGGFCFAQGGEAKLLPSRAGQQQDRDGANMQLQIPGSETHGDGAVTAAQFPPGVPLPPVKRLPAEFECPVCFKVKKFQKPSDWTKHVHEDVQPFTCTFAHCNDFKSFKRKADWVRHETERHRKLEWWSCTYPDCHHTCYRKDNFVQHLVREHKMPEPKPKKTTTPKSSGAASAEDVSEDAGDRERGLERLWEMVETCRHDTPNSPRDEPCRFCGNICSSWKKLTVHLAKHMEQIAMPVLELVKERDLPSAANNATDVHNANNAAAAGLGSSNTFEPYLNGTKTSGEPGHRHQGGINMAQGLYANLNPEQPMVAGFSHPTYPPPQLTTTLVGGMISAEPESYNPPHPHGDANNNAYGMDVDVDVDLGGSTTGGHANLDNGSSSQFIPVQSVHPNAVTYPPPNLSSVYQQNQYHLTIPVTEAGATGTGPVYDLQGSLCSSPGAESDNNMGYPLGGTVAPALSLSYDSSMVTNNYSRSGETGYM